MVNFVGRLFVILVFALSLMLFSVALAVYVNHVPWKSSNRDQPGLIDRLEASTKEAALARSLAEERYNRAFSELVQVEQQRAQRMAFYRYTLDVMKTGRDAQGQTVATPVYDVKLGPDGLMPIQFPRPEADVVRTGNGVPLPALETLEKQLALRNEELLAEKAKVEQLQRQLADLTTQMQGDGAQIVGLIRQKEIQAEARLRALAQQEYLKPELANRFAEATIMLKREAELRRRVEGGAGAATAQTRSVPMNRP
jgi:hypothetical protein